MIARTAESYSEQGTTDLTEVMVIDEMTQCKVCIQHSAKRKSLCTCGAVLQELSGKRKNDERNNGARDDSLHRFAVANQEKRLTKHLNQASQHLSNRKASFLEGAK